MLPRAGPGPATAQAWPCISKARPHAAGIETANDDDDDDDAYDDDAYGGDDDDDDGGGGQDDADADADADHDDDVDAAIVAGAVAADDDCYFNEY